MLAATVAAFTSCCTVFTGSSDAVTFGSRPDGASVILDGQRIGRTPCQGIVSRAWGRGAVLIERNGEKIATSVPREVNPALATDAVVTVFFPVIGVVSLLVDVGTGNCRKSSAKGVYVEFTAAGKVDAPVAQPPAREMPPGPEEAE